MNQQKPRSIGVKLYGNLTGDKPNWGDILANFSNSTRNIHVYQYQVYQEGRYMVLYSTSTQIFTLYIIPVLLYTTGTINEGRASASHPKWIFGQAIQAIHKVHLQCNYYCKSSKFLSRGWRTCPVVTLKDRFPKMQRIQY